MIQEYQSLKKYNTFGIEVSARYFAEAKTVAELEDVLAWYRAEPDCPLLVLGGGSNVLFTRNWPGLALKISLKGKIAKGEIVTAAAGEAWHDFVLWTLEQGLSGLENLSLIPGQVGTAPMQNIGAYGVEIKDVFQGLEAINIENGTTKIFTHKDCHFGYRESVFKNKEKGKWIITAVNFKLSKTAEVHVDYGTIKAVLEAHKIKTPTPKQVSQTVSAIRQAKLPDPAKLGSAGSFFKNPVVRPEVLKKIKVQYPEVPHYEVNQNLETGLSHLEREKSYKLPAGWLIEKAGWKGHNRQTHGVHEHQALVLVNYGGATGEEILALAKEIQTSVATLFNITLTPEVNII